MKTTILTICLMLPLIARSGEQGGNAVIAGIPPGVYEAISTEGFQMFRLDITTNNTATLIRSLSTPDPAGCTYTFLSTNCSVRNGRVRIQMRESDTSGLQSECAIVGTERLGVDGSVEIRGKVWLGGEMVDSTSWNVRFVKMPKGSYIEDLGALAKAAEFAEGAVRSNLVERREKRNPSQKVRPPSP